MTFMRGFATIRTRRRPFLARSIPLMVLTAAALLLALAPPARATDYPVTSTADSGANTLRQAIIDANGHAGADSISFSLTGCPCTITLATQLPDVTETLTITGPGADKLTISGNNSVRVLKVASGKSLTLENLTVANGRDTTDPYLPKGAGVYSEGPLTITDCTFSGNRANTDGGDHFGGAIYFAGGTLSISGSTFFGNTAHSIVASGGAVYASGTVTVTNSTFTGNTTTPTQSWGYGSAIYLSSGTLNMTHCTVHDNTSVSDRPVEDPAGAIYVGSGTATLVNTIIANNTGGNCGPPQTTATITDGGGNLQFGDDTCGATIPVADPKLGSLADNGGATQTMALPMDSPAVDACSCTTVVTDQRGEPRGFDWSAVVNDGGRCDIGAYELDGTRAFMPTVLQNVQ